MDGFWEVLFDFFFGPPWWAVEQSDKLDYIIERLDELVSDQDKLNEDVSAIVSAVGAIATEIDALKNQPAAPSLDFTGLDAAVAAVQGLAPAPAPVDPAA